MNIKKWTISIILLALLSACSQPEDHISIKQYSVTFEDALGETVIVKTPEKVVALMGGLAETWILAGGQLVGVTDDAIHERQLPLSENIVNLGQPNNPNAESILALQPDLVLLSSQTGSHVALKPLLQQAGIQTAYFNINHFDDYLALLDICTQITGQEDLFLQNGLALQEEINDIIRENAGKTAHPEILLMITYSGGTAIQNSETMAGQMLKELGCVNIADKDPSLLKEYSIEKIIRTDPDFIFVIPMGNSDDLAATHLVKSTTDNPAWNGLSAVKNGRYILLDKEHFLYKPNHKWKESYAILAEVLYGSP